MTAAKSVAKVAPSQPAAEQGWGVMEKVITQGDLSQLSPQERIQYYRAVCESVKLNPLTKPFAYLQLQNGLTLYATKAATDQLRQIHSVSIEVVSSQRLEDVYVVTARATLPDGRTDTEIGAVHIGNLRGDSLANALMKATTKAKRRVTLSICGLGMIDETEVETIPHARTEVVDMATGEIVEKKSSRSTPQVRQGRADWSSFWTYAKAKRIHNAEDFSILTAVPLPQSPAEAKQILDDALEELSRATEDDAVLEDASSLFEG